jgi:hypothetical protein
MSYEVYVPFKQNMSERMSRMGWAVESFGYTPYTQVMDTNNPRVLYLFHKEEEAILFALKWA